MMQTYVFGSLFFYGTLKFGRSKYCTEKDFAYSAAVRAVGVTTELVQAEVKHIRQTVNLVSNESQKLMVTSFILLGPDRKISRVHGREEARQRGARPCFQRPAFSWCNRMVHMCKCSTGGCYFYMFLLSYYTLCQKKNKLWRRVLYSMM